MEAKRSAVICMVGSGIVDGSEVKSTRTAGKRAKGRSCQPQTLTLITWRIGQRGLLIHQM